MTPDRANARYKEIVRSGYNECANAYHESRSAKPGAELEIIMDRLARGSSVLDIGCGAGVPVARALSKRCDVTGVDISEAMIELARKNVPKGKFMRGDIMSLEFEPSTFDAATAFYSIFHIPRSEHLALFRRIHGWLKPEGYMLCLLPNHGEEAHIEDFFGTTMYWSGYALEDYEGYWGEVGFEILKISVAGSGFKQSLLAPPESHPLVFARKRKANR